MERTLGFFEAWRAKRREKKNEELERLSAVRVEGGVLAKYLKLRAQEAGEKLSSFQCGTSKESETNSSREKEAGNGDSSTQDGMVKSVFKTSLDHLNSSSAFVTSVESSRTSINIQNINIKPQENKENADNKPIQEKEERGNVSQFRMTSSADAYSIKKSTGEGSERKEIREKIEKVTEKIEKVTEVTCSNLSVSKMTNALTESSDGKQNEMKGDGKTSETRKNLLRNSEPDAKKEKDRSVVVNETLESPKNETSRVVVREMSGPQEDKMAAKDVKFARGADRSEENRKETEKKSEGKNSEKNNVGLKSDTEMREKPEPNFPVGLSLLETAEKTTEPSTFKSSKEQSKLMTELKTSKSEPLKKTTKKAAEGVRKTVAKPDLLESKSQRCSSRNVKAEETDIQSEKAKMAKIPEVGVTVTQKKHRPLKESLRREVIEEAVKFQENMTLLTDNANQIECGVVPENQETGNGSLTFRKDPKKLQKKLKTNSTPDEPYPKTKNLITKPIKEQESTKLEPFLRDALSPPTSSGDREPMKTMEAVVEEILTSTSDKSNHEKPSNLRYTSRGEVIHGVVSIKPSNSEIEDGLSAITLVPAFRPEIEDSLPKTSEGVDQPQPPQRDCFSPISDLSDDSYDHYVASVDCSLESYSTSRRRSLRSSSTPRRIFPQMAKPSPYRTDRAKEESPVVFDAGLSFDIGSKRTALRHRFQPQPAFTEMKTSSSSLSLRISDFLKRTDHIMEEWKSLGKGGEDLQDLVPTGKSWKSKSATNIMIRGLLNYSKGSRTPSLRSRSLAKTSETSDRTISDIDELSEMTLDLSEERATGTMQAERLEAETAERVRLEQELAQVQSEKKNLQQTTEKLEMELFYARADVNGLSESEADLEDGGGDASLYKNKCERAMRELEFTRRRLQQQHEDDLEQLVALKKQLEKKLADAYEEVEEQRQVAAQWKRKVQKLQSETNDLRLLLEEQSSRNNLLEKKQRKFDSEIQMLQEELRSERNQKERSSREREMAVAEKYSLEQNLSSVRLELELKEEKVSALTRELEELSRGGGSEQEVTQLRKAKHDLEMKLKEQEEELDELAGQVSMLEANKLRLEMSLESLRKEHRREMAQRDDELDEVRANGQKKIKVLESQLESEHEERTLLVREKHELERRLADAEERGRHHRAAEEDALQRARRDLKKTKALLRDAQIMLERVKQDSPSKAALRALKNQLEDVELARASAVKAKQSLEAELNEVTGQLEEALRAKGDAENRSQSAVREMNSLRTQVDENEEELAELLKKYRQTVQQLSAEQLANQETAGALAEAEAERASLREQLAELTARLEANAVVDPISDIAQKKLEIRIKELESRLELEQTTRGRLEVQITRLKENVERLNEECVQARTKEQGATDLARKLQRSLREAKEELAAHQAKEQEAAHKRKELEKRLEAAEVEASTARTDLRLAVKRIEDLQSAISGEIGSDSERSESEEEDSENDSLVSHSISSTSRTSRTPELAPR